VVFCNLSRHAIHSTISLLFDTDTLLYMGLRGTDSWKQDVTEKFRW